MKLNPEEQEQLLSVAFQSIWYGLEAGHEMEIDLNEYSPQLQRSKACFVTLRKQAALRGCVGAIVAQRPLVLDVVHNAFAAAFRDDRFPPLMSAEFAEIQLSISVLGPLERLEVRSRRDLCDRMRSNCDGIIIRTHSTGATFLPVMWHRFPDAEEFLGQLMMKAGLPAEYWSAEVQVDRFCVENTILSPGYKED